MDFTPSAPDVGDRADVVRAPNADGSPTTHTVEPTVVPVADRTSHVTKSIAVHVPVNPQSPSSRVHIPAETLKKLHPNGGVLTHVSVSNVTNPLKTPVKISVTSGHTDDHIATAIHDSRGRQALVHAPAYAQGGHMSHCADHCESTPIDPKFIPSTEDLEKMQKYSGDLRKGISSYTNDKGEEMNLVPHSVPVLDEHGNHERDANGAYMYTHHIVGHTYETNLKRFYGDDAKPSDMLKGMQHHYVGEDRPPLELYSVPKRIVDRITSEIEQERPEQFPDGLTLHVNPIAGTRGADNKAYVSAQLNLTAAE